MRTCLNVLNAAMRKGLLTALLSAAVLAPAGGPQALAMPKSAPPVQAGGQGRTGGMISIFDLMTTDQISDVKSGSATMDLTTVFANALAVNDVLYCPKGTYLCNIKIVKRGKSIIGDGPDLTIFKQKRITAPILWIKSDLSVNGGGDQQITGSRFSGFTLAGSAKPIPNGADPRGVGAGVGLQVEAFSPYVVANCEFSNLFIRNVATGLNMVCGAANETFQNNFFNLYTFNTTILAAHIKGFYNSFTNFTTSFCMQGTAILDEGWNTTYTMIAADSQCSFSGANIVANGLAIESIVNQTFHQPSQAVLNISGSGMTLNGCTLTDIGPAQVGWGIVVNGKGHHLSNISFLGTHYPKNPIALQSGSSGVINNIRMSSNAGITPLQFQTSPETLANWNISGDVADVWNGAMSWVPTFTNLAAPGAIITATWTKVGSLLFAEVIIKGAAITVAAGKTRINATSLPRPGVGTGGICTVSASNGVGYGVGSIQGDVFLPEISALNTTLMISLLYRVAP
jgi:hypothetical protein